MAHSVYSPKDVNISWNGITVTGYADDTFVVLNRNADLTDEMVGADGTLATTLVADRTGTITITLMQTAETNILLSAIAELQDSAEVTSLLRSAITVSDPSGSALAVGSGAYIKAMPEVTLGSAQNAKEWVFYCEDLNYISVPETAGAAVTETVKDAQAKARELFGLS